MRTRNLVLGVAISMTAAAALWFVNSQELEMTEVSSNGAATETPPLPESAIPETQPEVDPARQNDPTDLAPTPENKIEPRSSEEHGSTVPDEVTRRRAWAEETHQTSQETLSAIAQMDDSELEEFARTGDPIAQKEYGTRLVRNRGNIHDGIEWLAEAASHGSPSAARELASIYLHGVNGIAPDNLAFLAWSQVALFMGDWTALVGFGYQIQLELSIQERILVDAFTAELLMDLNERSLGRTGHPLTINPRPGFRTITNP